MAKYTSIAAAAFVFTIPTQAGVQKPLPQLLKEVETKYSQANTISADFSQTTEDVVLSRKKNTSGKILIKRPSKVRWETLTPDKSLLVSDGVKYWFYTPPFEEGEAGQVIEKKSSDVQSKLANALLSGAFSTNREMKIKQKGASSFLLTPKPGTAGTVAQAEVEIDPQSKLIQKVILNHKGGNRAEIRLSQIQLGEVLSDDLFLFKAPPNTNKVDEFNGK